MDNITHSLFGMLVAEAALSFRKNPSPELRASAYLLSALANNLPDTDVVYSSWLTSPKPLGSLLHHRGHTHTLLFALPAAWSLYRIALWLWARRQRHFAGAEARLLLGLCLAGPLLHLLLDFGNNYGVHPFWPVDARWFYGDSIFIVEPLWWAATIPLLAARVARRWLKLLLWGLLGAVLVACWYVPFVVPASRYALLALVAVSYAVARWTTPRVAASYACGACLLVALIFSAGAARAEQALRQATHGSFPALEIYDVVTSPVPANPACWEGLVAGEQAGTYRVLRAKVSLPPLSLGSCMAGADVEPTAPVERLDRAERQGVRFLTELRQELSQLRALRRDDCRFRALLKFTRLPYAFTTRPSGQLPGLLKAGDLRYDRQPDRDFSDAEFGPLGEQPCPRFVPGWREPRADLLEIQPMGLGTRPEP